MLSKSILSTCVRQRSKGVTLLEVIGSLAVGATLSVLMIQLLTNLSEDQASIGLRRHHQMLADAATTHLEKNSLALQDQLDVTGQTELRLPLATYQANSGLPVGWRDTNPMGQASCLVVYSEIVNNQSRLQGLLITQGGRDMPASLLWPAAMVQKHGVGVLELDPNTQRIRAIGYRAQWEVRQQPDGGPLSGLDCTGAPLSAGHFATFLNVRSPAHRPADGDAKKCELELPHNGRWRFKSSRSYSRSNSQHGWRDHADTRTGLRPK